MRKKRMKHSKKQFRLYDIYRYIVTGDVSDIEGIVSYDANKDASVIVVRYVDYTGTFPEGLAHNYFSRNEKELKTVVYEVNKILCNCFKPGPKRGKKNGKL